MRGGATAMASESGRRDGGRTPGTGPTAAAPEAGHAPAARPGFLRRHRLPLLLALVALCLYVGSILYILYGRGQVA